MGFPSAAGRRHAGVLSGQRLVGHLGRGCLRKMIALGTLQLFLQFVNCYAPISCRAPLQLGGPDHGVVALFLASMAL